MVANENMQTRITCALIARNMFQFLTLRGSREGNSRLVYKSYFRDNSMFTKDNLYILVTYAGALPFIACAIMLYSGIHTLDGFGQVNNISAVFALIIVSFISGIHLGTYLFYNTKTPKPLFIISNVIAATAWISLLVANIKIAIAVLIFAFIYLLLVDYLLKRELFISKNYFNTRLIVTLITTGSLLITSNIS